MKRSAPAAERNRGAIVEALRPRLPSRGLLLEVASGAGIHALALAKAFPDLEIQPTDPDPTARESIEAWRNESDYENLLPPLELDARTPDWPVEKADGVFCANMIHIAPWSAAIGLMSGAGRVLSEGSALFTYGPFLVDGAPTTESNAAFDAALRSRDPAWGLRDLSQLDGVGQQAGLSREEILSMPANNFLLVWRKRSI